MMLSSFESRLVSLGGSTLINGMPSVIDSIMLIKACLCNSIEMAECKREIELTTAEILQRLEEAENGGPEGEDARSKSKNLMSLRETVQRSKYSQHTFQTFVCKNLTSQTLNAVEGVSTTMDSRVMIR